MLKVSASENANRFVGLHDPQEEAAVCAALCEVVLDHSGIARQPAAAGSISPESGPAAASTIARSGDVPTSLWWSVLASFGEGFGAYGMALYPVADFPARAVFLAREQSLQHMERAKRQRQRISVMSASRQRAEIPCNPAVARYSTRRRHGAGIRWRSFMTPPLPPGRIGAGNERSSRLSRHWPNSTIGRCGISAFPAEPRSSKS